MRSPVRIRGGEPFATSRGERTRTRERCATTTPMRSSPSSSRPPQAALSVSDGHRLCRGRDERARWRRRQGRRTTSLPSLVYGLWSRFRILFFAGSSNLLPKQRGTQAELKRPRFVISTNQDRKESYGGMTWTLVLKGNSIEFPFEFPFFHPGPPHHYRFGYFFGASG